MAAVLRQTVEKKMLMGLNLIEAAHRLRMTVHLLLWFSRNAAKRDGRKLQIADATIEEGELLAFNEHLRGAWPNKNPGSGIERELEKEALGMCGHCESKSDVMENAHIDRLDRELDHRCQHPHNLIRLCPGCHSRYDKLGTITNDTLKHRKEILLARLLENVDRDVQLQKTIRTAVQGGLKPLVEDMVAQGIESALKPLVVAQTLLLHSETAVRGATTALPTTIEDAETRFKELIGTISVERPITVELLRSYAGQVHKGELPDLDENVDIPFDDWEPKPGECLRCSAQTGIDYGTCTGCDAELGLAGENPDTVDVVSDGTYRLYFEDPREGITAVECDDCGSEIFWVEFNVLCDYCEHMANKDD